MVYVPTRAKWRAWLRKHHRTRREIWLLYYKKGSGKPRVEYGDAVEEALCYGWIDSTVKTLDAERYAQRFTPRKPGSNWSRPNLERVKRLVANGLMTPAGAALLPSAREARAFDAKHEKRVTGSTAAPAPLAAALRSNGKAAAFWKSLSPGYRRLYVRWATEAKKAETKERRVKKIVSLLARGVKHPLATLVLAATLAMPVTLGAQGFDQNAVGRTVLRELIETNTTPSIGNTTKASELMAAHFRAAGVPESDIAIVGPDDTHKNLIVRIRGSDRARKPILLLAHLDVVEAERTDWSVDPFVLHERDGFYYGRGTQDVKGGAATLVTALLRMRAEGVTPSRDLILALTAGEEGGMPNGVQWLLANRRDLIDAEYTVNVDGGGADSEDGRPTVLEMQAAEKVYLDLRLTVRNRGGHSSLPRDDNAIASLARAISRIAEHRFPVEMSEITRTYFERVAPMRPPAVAADLRAVARPGGTRHGAAVRRLSADPWFNALMRTTCVTTMLDGGHAPNALPQTATANVNCRRLPGVGSDSVIRVLTRVIADTGVDITIVEDSPQSPPSPLRADVEAAVRAASEALGPRLPIIPLMETGATDGLFLRNAGIPVYGLSGIAIDVGDKRSHGRDERIRVSAFEAAQEYTYRLLRNLTAERVTP